MAAAGRSSQSGSRKGGPQSYGTTSLRYLRKWMLVHDGNHRLPFTDQGLAGCCNLLGPFMGTSQIQGMNGSKQSSMPLAISHPQVVKLEPSFPEPGRRFGFRPPPLGNQWGRFTRQAQWNLSELGRVALGSSSVGRDRALGSIPSGGGAWGGGLGPDKSAAPPPPVRPRSR
jgi:hypothetical protein